MDTHDRLIQALTNRALYTHPTTEITVLQTHISWVVLTGLYAYKIKKPINVDFDEFSTLAQRHFFCQEELRLNRRLAPQLYLEVVAISGTPKRPRLRGRGTRLEYAVKMVQFAQDSLLSHRLAVGQLQGAHIDHLAREVSAFHARIATAAPLSRFGTPEAIYQQVRKNFQPLFDIIDDPVRQAHARVLEVWCQRTFAAHRATFVARKRDGFVRECHGDLHLENMILCDDEVVIFDCLEFNEDLRWIDVASDVAFLTMDLEDRGRPDLAHRFLNSYLEATGAIRLRSDVERKRLCRLAPFEQSADRSDLKLYTPDVTRRTYAHLAQQAVRVIEAGFPVVVDATFLQRAQRDAFRHLAAQLNVPCTLLAFRADEATLRRRVAQHRAPGDDASEADLAVLDGQVATLESLTDEEQAAALTIDTDAPQAPQRLLEAVHAMDMQA